MKPKMLACAALLAMSATGCLGRSSAEELARLTYAEVIEYELSVRAASRAVLRAVEDRTAARGGALSRSGAVRISVKEGALAQAVVDRVLQRGFRSHDLSAFLVEAFALDAEGEADLLGRIQGERVAAQQRLALEENRARRLRISLEELQRRRGVRDWGRVLLPLAREALDSRGAAEDGQATTESGSQD